MKAILALVMLVTVVRLGLDLSDEIAKRNDNLSFVRHLASSSLTLSNPLSKCLTVAVSPPSIFQFNGSNYLFKLLRLAYFTDLKNDVANSSATDTVLKVALASTKSYKCTIADDVIYKLVKNKFPDPCVVPSRNTAHFKPNDLKDISDRSDTCLEKLNTMVDSIIDGFNDITSEDQKFFNTYFDGLNLLFLAYANGYEKKENDNKFKLRFLLLNELLSGYNKLPNKEFGDDIKKLTTDLNASLTLIKDDINKVTSDQNTSLPLVENEMGNKSDNANLEKTNLLNELMYLKDLVLNNLIGDELKGKKQKEIDKLLESIDKSQKRRVI